MSSTRSSRSPNRTPSLQLIINDLREGIRNLRQTVILILPLVTMKLFGGSSEPIESPYLPDLVALFDDENQDLCSKLDVASFWCILRILLRSMPCIARDRGFYLFLRSLRSLTDMAANDTDENKQAARQRKVALGKMCVNALFKVFIHDNSELARSWSAQIVLELIRGCETNFILLPRRPTELMHLGRIILYEKDYDLRILSAIMIQEMISRRLDPEIFWPPDTNYAYTSFFKPAPTSSMSKTEVDSSRMLAGVSRLCQKIDENHIPRESLKPGTVPKVTRMVYVESLITVPTKHGIRLHSIQNTGIGVIGKNEHLTFYVVNVDRIRIINVPMRSIQKAIVTESWRRGLDIFLVEGATFLDNGLAVTAKMIYVALRYLGDDLEEVQSALNRESFYEAIPNASLSDTGSNQENESTEEARELDRHAISTAIDFPELDEKSDDSLVRIPKRRIGGICEVEETPPKRMKAMASSMAIALPKSDETSAEPEYNLQGEVEPNKASRKKSLESVESGYGSLNTESPSNDAPKVITKPLDIQLPSTEIDESEVDSRCGSAERGAQDLLNAVIEEVQRRTSQTTNSTTSNHDSDIQVTGSRCIGNTETVGEDSSPESMKPTPASHPATTAGGSKELNGLASATSSRLKRPHHKISGYADKEKYVDWDEDIRVDDDDKQFSTAKKQKKTPANKNVSKEKKQPASAGVTKNASRMLSLSPESPRIKSAPVKRVTKKENRQVPKTLASTRPRRVAADKAIKKLALATEQEDLPYDVDDPIESSVPEAPKPAQSMKHGESNIYATNMTQAGAFPGSQVPTLLSSDENTSVHAEVQVLFTWPEKIDDQNEKTCTSSTKNRKRKPTEVDASTARNNDIDENSPSSKRLNKTRTAYSKQPQADGLGGAPKTDGTLPMNQGQKENLEPKENQVVPKPRVDRTKVHPKSVTKASQVSRNVSLFIARQHAKEQKVDVTEGAQCEAGENRKDPTLCKALDDEKAGPKPSVSFDENPPRLKKNTKNPQTSVLKPVLENENQVCSTKSQSKQDDVHTKPSDAQQPARLPLKKKGEPTGDQPHTADTANNCADTTENVSAKEAKRIPTPNIDPFIDTFQKKGKFPNPESHQPEHESSPLSDKKTDTSNSECLHRDTDDSDDSDDSVYVMPRDEFIRRCTQRRTLNSQAQTVDENGSPQPRQFSRNCKLEISGSHIERLNPDYGTNKTQPKGPLAGQSDSNARNPNAEQLGPSSEANSGNDSVMAVGVDTSSDRSATNHQQSNGKKGKAPRKKAVASATRKSTTKAGKGRKKDLKPTPVFSEKDQKFLSWAMPGSDYCYDPDCLETSARNSFRISLAAYTLMNKHLICRMRKEKGAIKRSVDVYGKGANKILDQMQEAHEELLNRCEEQQPHRDFVRKLIQAVSDGTEQYKKLMDIVEPNRTENPDPTATLEYSIRRELEAIRKWEQSEEE